MFIIIIIIRRLIKYDNKRKYSSYKGEIGKVAPNIIQRKFFSDVPNKKWYTDITDFNLRGNKLYLSPILDGCAGDIVSYRLSRSPNLNQVIDMANEAITKNYTNGLIFHSDQGWQYQHSYYQKLLKDNGIIQSMSRKGNSIDDGLLENFFGLLKTEMFSEQEYKYKGLNDLSKAVDDYIYYYNNDRIKRPNSNWISESGLNENCLNFETQFKAVVDILKIDINYLIEMTKIK